MPDNFKARAEEAAAALMQKLSSSSCTLALSESCTAGLVSDLLACIPGASAVLWGSFVCYTEEAKISMLGIEREKIASYGLVSGEVASLMALGALEKSGANAAAGVTGLAGPSGDGSNVPVGTVWAAAVYRPASQLPSGEGAGVFKEVKEFHFSGSRNEVRIQAAIAVLELLDKILHTHG